MTQVKLWQIVSQTPNGIVFADADGTLTSLQAAAANQVLVAGPDGAPMWADNTALTTALDAKADVNTALAAAKAYTEAQIAALVNNAPIALDTLNELAQKLSGDETALNALIAQMESKAGKDEVAAQITQAKQEAYDASSAYTNTVVSDLAGSLITQIQTAKAEAVAEAAADASQKASDAQVAAVQEANGYTDQRLSHELGGVAIETNNKISELRDSIPDVFQAESTSTACFLASSTALPKEITLDGVCVAEQFTEITGLNINSYDPTLNAKLVFVNGVAVSEGWEATRDVDGKLFIRFSGRLADHVFDGSENALMILVEYKSFQAIGFKS